MHRDICTQPKLYAKQRVNSLWASVYNRCHASYNRWLWFRMHISVCLSMWQTEKPNGFHAIWTSRTHLIWMSLYSIWNCKNSCILIKKHFSFERFRVFFCCVNVFCFSTAIAFCKKRALYETSDRRISLWALANTPNRVAHQCHFTSEVFFSLLFDIFAWIVAWYFIAMLLRLSSSSTNLWCFGWQNIISTSTAAHIHSEFPTCVSLGSFAWHRKSDSMRVMAKSHQEKKSYLCRCTLLYFCRTI